MQKCPMQWFNGKHKRSGTLREQRFKSVIAEHDYQPHKSQPRVRGGGPMRWRACAPGSARPPEAPTPGLPIADFTDNFRALRSFPQ